LGLTIRVVGQASRRGLIPRLPTPDRLLADTCDWINGEYAGYVRSARIEGTVESAELLLDVHPAAEPVSITADAEGRVVASADTSAVGPGYHTFVARVLERLEGELGIEWSREHEARPIDAPPAWVGARTPLAERPSVERAHLALLGRTITRAIELRRRGAPAFQVGTRPGTQFTFEGAVATPVGPRDDAWLVQAVKDPRVATDIRPWWLDATDARYLLQRALVLLWTEIRWRPPADDLERATMDEALSLLRRALPSDPTLAYPWREWAELIELRGIGDPMAERVAQRVASTDQQRPLIGYRRRPVSIIHEGWALQVPGSFGERRTAEEWTGSERGRRVTLAAVTTATANGIPMSAEWFLTRVANDLPGEVMHHRDGELQGRARITTDQASGVEVAVLEGFSAVTGRGAAIRIEFEEAGDWRWAIDLWRSLRPAAA
jgi:hypothetical protein